VHHQLLQITSHVKLNPELWYPLLEFLLHARYVSKVALDIATGPRLTAICSNETVKFIHVEKLFKSNSGKIGVKAATVLMLVTTSPQHLLYTHLKQNTKGLVVTPGKLFPLRSTLGSLTGYKSIQEALKPVFNSSTGVGLLSKWGLELQFSWISSRMSMSLVITWTVIRIQYSLRICHNTVKGLSRICSKNL